MIKIAHLYYDIMNLYGDNGNIKALKQELENQGQQVQISFLTLNEKINFKNFDFVYIGCGTENSKKIVLNDLLKYKDDIQSAIDKNTFFLITGNAIELFGKEITTIDGKKLKALGIFKYTSKEESFRLVDEAIFNTDLIEKPILGFQNQSSTIEGIKDPIFKVTKGIGSYPSSKTEGIKYNNFWATYLIGPILARNPELLKYFVKELITSKEKNFKFKKFNLDIETKAYENYIKNFYPNVTLS